MLNFDLVIKNGQVVTASDSYRCDIGIADGKIVALAKSLNGNATVLDATDKLVMPGGIDSHCHIEQESSMGIICADDFASGTISAAFGGTTTIMPFAAQGKGQSLRDVINQYHARAGPKAVIDYAFHLIIADPNEQVIGQELPALIRDGYTSFKVYMTYERLKIDDAQMLTVLAAARRYGAMVMVHAENHEMIQWLTQRLLEGGHTAPKYHSVAHARLAEGEATHRAIKLSELADTPMLIVHVSAEEAVTQIRHAQDAGLRIYAETCPQYLYLTADDLDKNDMDGAKWCCSPPPRDVSNQPIIWRGLANGTFQVFSSDHAPYRLDETGKLFHGKDASFNKIANGVPGVELRLPLLFQGVRDGKLTLQQFVALGATNAAHLYGLSSRKGSIAVGLDADIAIWDPNKEVTVTYDMLHDNVGYTPYEGLHLYGWPETVLSRGRIVVKDGDLHVERGTGEFLPCDSPASAVPNGDLVQEMDPSCNHGAQFF